MQISRSVLQPGSFPLGLRLSGVGYEFARFTAAAQHLTTGVVVGAFSKVVSSAQLESMTAHAARAPLFVHFPALLRFVGRSVAEVSSPVVSHQPF